MKNLSLSLAVLVCFALLANAQPRVIEFPVGSGIMWEVRPTGSGGPSWGTQPGQQNHWSSSENNVWRDTQGRLHLKLTNAGGYWNCAEIYTQESFGYGEYIFWLDSRIDQLDQHVVAGLFTYRPPDGVNELDIEFTTWSNQFTDNSQYVVYGPKTNPPPDFDWRNRFQTNLNGDCTSHRIKWNPFWVNFRSLHGHYFEPPNDSFIIAERTYDGISVSKHDYEKVHINLWLTGAPAPSNNQEVEIIISNFMFIPNTLWTRNFGGNSDDGGYSVKQTSDGGYIICGYTRSYGAGEGDVYLIKTDATGNQQWQRAFGDIYYDCGNSVQQTSDGGYIIAGWTYYFVGNFLADVYLIKTDVAGNQQWESTFGEVGDQDYGYSVLQTGDGGYIIAGYTQSVGAGYSDVYLIKTDASGNQQWQRTFGGSNRDGGYSVQQTSDGGYIIAGYTESFGAGYSDVYLIKTNTSGNQQWQRTFGGSGWDIGYSVQQTSDGGYIIVGYTYSFGAGSADVYLIKTNASGNQQWQRTFGGSSQDEGKSVQQTSDGGYIIAGYTGSFGVGGDVYLIKTDASGNQQWSQTFGGSFEDWGYSLQQTSDGGYIITGSTSSYGAGNGDVYLIRLAGSSPCFPLTLTPHNPPIRISNGGGSFNFDITAVNNTGINQTLDFWTEIDVPHRGSVPMLSLTNTILPPITITRTRGQNIPAYAPADTYAYNAYIGYFPLIIYNYDAFNFIKLEGDDEVETSSPEEWLSWGEPLFCEVNESNIQPSSFSIHNSHPNPFNSSTVIDFDLPQPGEVSLVIYDIQGREVARLADSFYPAGTHQVEWDASAKASGVYFARLMVEGFQQTRKLLLIK